MSCPMGCKKYVKWMIALLLLAMIAAGCFYYFKPFKTEATVVPHEVNIKGKYLSEPVSVHDFNLVDNHGKIFTKANLKGRWTMMFFGFTKCGYVCPTTLVELNRMYVELEKTLPNNQLPQVVLVSVDPERDTVSKMDKYVNSFNAHFIGVTGTPSEIQKVEKQLNITAQKIQLEDQSKGEYAFNHSAEILLFNPDGDLQAYLTYPHKAEQLIKDYKLSIMEKGQ